MMRIKQEHSTGCGIACVAMIAASNYQSVLSKARELFGWPKTQRSLYTYSAQLVQLLEELNIAAGRGRMIRCWSSLPALAIVGINHNMENDTWHYVVFCRERDKEYVLDPRTKSDVRTDFWRLRLRSYIPITTRQ